MMQFELFIRYFLTVMFIGLFSIYTDNIKRTTHLLLKGATTMWILAIILLLPFAVLIELLKMS